MFFKYKKCSGLEKEKAFGFVFPKALEGMSGLII